MLSFNGSIASLAFWFINHHILNTCSSLMLTEANVSWQSAVRVTEWCLMAWRGRHSCASQHVQCYQLVLAPSVYISGISLSRCHSPCLCPHSQLITLSHATVSMRFMQIHLSAVYLAVCLNLSSSWSPSSLSVFMRSFVFSIGWNRYHNLPILLIPILLACSDTNTEYRCWY